MSPEELFESLLARDGERSRPPVHLWNPERLGAIDIEIDAEGVWWHEGREFQRPALVELFASILRCDEGEYFLVTPVEKLAIRVRDVPFTATDMDVRGSGDSTDLLFTTSVGDLVLADDSHAIEMREGRPYVHVRDGLWARLTRSVYYRLSDLCVEEGGSLCVYSQGARFILSEMRD